MLVVRTSFEGARILVFGERWAMRAALTPRALLTTCFFLFVVFCVRFLICTADTGARALRGSRCSVIACEQRASTLSGFPFVVVTHLVVCAGLPHR